MKFTSLFEFFCLKLKPEKLAEMFFTRAELASVADGWAGCHARTAQRRGPLRRERDASCGDRGTVAHGCGERARKGARGGAQGTRRGAGYLTVAAPPDLGRRSDASVGVRRRPAVSGGA